MRMYEKVRLASLTLVIMACFFALIRLNSCGQEAIVQDQASPAPSSLPTPPPSSCGKVTFADVKPVISQYCLSCHAGFDQYSIAASEGPKMALRVNLQDSDNQRMPKQPNPPLSAEKKALFTKWQEGGFLEICPQATSQAKQFYNFDSIETAIQAKAKDLSQDDRFKSRFLVLTHKIDQGASASDLSLFFSAAHKAVNSLNTQNSRIEKLEPIGPQGSVLRIQLDDFGLSANDWDLIVKNDPFQIESFTNKGQDIKNLYGTRFPWLHFDNFINISHGNPDVYYSLTRVPATFDAIVKKLGVNFVGDQRNFTANFIGTNRSPISDQKSRLITEFKSSDGEFWETFDPGPVNGIAARNLFNAPLLIDTNVPFDFAAGEIIYSLKNGLQGYIIVDKNGNLLKVADPNIVRDVNSPVSSIILNSLSCFRCHSAGLIPATDEVLAHVKANGSDFGAGDTQRVIGLYKEQTVNDKLFKDYDSAHAQVLAKLDAAPNLDPVTYATDRFQLNWDSNQLASFLFLTKDELFSAINQSATGKQQLGAVLTGSSVSLDQVKVALKQVIIDARLFQDPIGH